MADTVVARLRDGTIWKDNHRHGMSEIDEAATDALMEEAANALESALSLSPAHGWRDIADAPKDGTDILVTNIEEWIAKVCWHKGAWLQVDADGVILGDLVAIAYPTHWMPLPAAPLPPKANDTKPKA